MEVKDWIYVLFKENRTENRQTANTNPFFARAIRQLEKYWITYDSDFMM